MSPSGTSSSSADWGNLPPGTLVGGFRIERRLAPGSLGFVYEATQVSLDRTVALRMLPPEFVADRGYARRLSEQQRLAASVHHRGLVPTFEAGAWEGGRFIATRFVRGRTLAAMTAGRGPTGDRLDAILEQVRAGLEDAHRAGLAHGAVNSRNVFVDASGDALLADLGLGRPGTPEEDRAALGALAAEAGEGNRRRRPAMLLAAALLIAVGAVVAILLGGSDVDVTATPAPAVAAGADALGSGLDPGPARAVGCAPVPTENTPACTIGQETVSGRAAGAEAGGAIRAWAVRGARGELTLQVIGEDRGGEFLRGFSQTESIADAGAHRFETDVPVRRGDRVAVLLSPGAEIGLREAGPDTVAERWGGQVSFAPLQLASTSVDGEVMLRADIEAGAQPRLEQKTGRAVAGADSGKVIDEQPIPAPTGAPVRVALVTLADGIAIDSFRGGLRRARLSLPDLEPAGHLLSLEGLCGFSHGVCLRWINPGEQDPVIHAYRVTGSGAFRLIG